MKVFLLVFAFNAASVFGPNLPSAVTPKHPWTCSITPSVLLHLIWYGPPVQSTYEDTLGIGGGVVPHSPPQVGSVYDPVGSSVQLPPIHLYFFVGVTVIFFL